MHMMSSFKHPILVRDHSGEDRAQAELLGRVMACAGFGLVLVAADRSIFYANDSGRLLCKRAAVCGASITSSAPTIQECPKNCNG